jgi:hypothetical protein
MPVDLPVTDVPITNDRLVFITGSQLLIKYRLNGLARLGKKLAGIDQYVALRFRSPTKSESKLPPYSNLGRANR